MDTWPGAQGAVVSDVKHQPKTPLPFKSALAVRDNASNYYVVHARGWPIPVAAMCDDEVDAAYLAHAAVQYQNLVKALKHLSGHHLTGDECRELAGDALQAADEA
jgi:hypothetical protein